MKITNINGASVKNKSLNKRLYTVPELMRVTKLTRKQINYWDKKGLLVPKLRNASARKGQPAYFYSAVEVVKALIICNMLKRGFSLQQVQRVARNLEKNGIRLGQTENYLLTDGYSVYYANNNSKVIDILKHEGQMLLIPIHEQVEKLKKAA